MEEEEPLQLREIATIATNRLLSEKSINEKEYKRFFDWCTQNNLKNITENNLIDYFEFLGGQSNKLWTIYSMLRTMLKTQRNIDITKFAKLKIVLKRLSSDGYGTTKSKTLETFDIYRFIADAPDDKYLAMKIALIMGYSGACRVHDLINITIDDIEYKNDAVFVTVVNTKTNLPRSFEIGNQYWVNLIQKYASLRPEQTTHRRFFLTYHRGCCSKQPIGINRMGQLPRAIATFLELPNPERYSGNCFRRSSALHWTNQDF